MFSSAIPTGKTDAHARPKTAERLSWLLPVAVTSVTAFVGGYIVVDPSARRPMELYNEGALLTFVLTTIALVLFWKKVRWKSVFTSACVGCAITWPTFMNLEVVPKSRLPLVSKQG